MSDDKKPRGDLFFNTSKNTPLKKEPQNEGRANLTRLAGDVEELRKGSQDAFIGLANALRELGARMGGQLNALALHVRRLDYRSLAISKILIEKSILSEVDVNALSESLQITDFNEESAKQDEAFGFQPVAVGAPAENGHIVVFGITGVYSKTKTDLDGTILPHPQAGKEYAPLCIFRHKICLGYEKTVPQLVQDNIVGLKEGDSKEFQLSLNPQDKAADVFDCKVTLYSIRIRPPKEEPSSDTVALVSRVQPKVDEAAAPVVEEAKNTTEKEGVEQ